ncbi:ABC transporter substrate-binding protein, partial [Sedimenticola sp.]
MNKGLLTFLLCIGTVLIADAAEPPQRIVSINLCTDQLLLMLGEPGQIASVSHLALEPNSSYMARQAKAYPVNHGKAEEILALKPDLIVAGAYTNRSLVGLLKKLGYRVERFPLASDIQDIRDNIRLMARLIDKKAQGELLVADMDSRLEQVKQQRPT